MKTIDWYGWLTLGMICLLCLPVFVLTYPLYIHAFEVIMNYWGW